MKCRHSSIGESQSRPHSSQHALAPLILVGLVAGANDFTSEPKIHSDAKTAGIVQRSFGFKLPGPFLVDAICFL